MSSSTLTDRIRLDYNAMLIYISFNLDENNQIQLRQYFHGLIPVDITAILELLRALEYNKNISWQDVNLLKEAMRVIRRLDLVKKLTEYECKRDLMLLLDFYARRIVSLDSYCCTVPVKKVAGQLERLMEIARDRINFKIISLTADSAKEIRKVLLNFQEVIDCRELEFSWNEFTMLVVIAGEVIAVAYSNEEQLEESVLELCSTAAEELCSRMVELGSWVCKSIIYLVMKHCMNVIIRCDTHLCVVCIYLLIPVSAIVLNHLVVS